MKERIEVQEIDGYVMIPLPDAISEALGLADGDVMEIEVVDGRIEARKAEPRPKT